jgi:hypothetical protein
MAQAAVPVRGTSQVHIGWLGIGALVVAVALVAGAAGYLIGGNQPAATSPDQALLDNLDGAWSTTYDPAKLAALYAEDAIFHDNVAGKTSTGLEAIKAKVSGYSIWGFTSTSTTAPVRQGNFIANFVRYGTDAADMSTGLSVVELEDGKIVNHWVYPAE